VIAVAYAIISESVAERPDFGYDLIGGHEMNNIDQETFLFVF
jgi:hypothetical protein